jgi:hypothetical protein
LPNYFGVYTRVSSDIIRNFIEESIGAVDLISSGIAGSNHHVYYRWSDGTVSSGTTSDPIRYRNYYFANLPNKTLASVDIASNDYVYYWWNDGTASVGTTDNPTYHRDFYLAY